MPEAILLMGAALSGTACGALPTEDGSVGEFASAIEGGQQDTEHASVFALFAVQRRALSACTATLIAPNLLLTARHCVSNTNHEEAVVCGRAEFGSLFKASDLHASNPVTLEDARTPWFTGAEIRIPEEGDDTCGYDIALVRLAENVPESVAKPAIPRIDRPVEDGELYTAVGYGVDLEGVQTGRQVLKDLRITCEPGACGRRAVVSEFVGETGICNGDSGGPALDVEGKVVGVVSRGAENCSFPIYGSVASWRDMIVGFAAQAAVIGGYEPPFWVKSGSSEPPPAPEPVVEPEPEPVAKPEPVPTAAGGAPEPAAVPAGVEPSGDAAKGASAPRSTCAYQPGGASGGSPWALLSLAALALTRLRRTPLRRR